MNQPPGPERRRVPGKFITMDAAMLAAQNERIDALIVTVEGLADAINRRPTLFDVERARKRLRNQLIAIVIGFMCLFGVVLWEANENRAQCMDRNSNTAAFRKLITFLVERTEDPPTSDALQVYLDTLKTPDC